MKIYKFIIDKDRPVQDAVDPAIEHFGCVAATVAANPDDARQYLTTFSATMGLDSAWLRVARVVEIPIVPGAVIAWAEV